jgi:hypothetical protein
MLTRAQKKQIFERGYVQIPGVIPQKRIQVALRAINHSLGQGMNRRDIATFRSSSFCPELLGRPPILDLLYETPLLKLAESAAENGLKLAGGGQIALRFPVMEFPGSMLPHIDGLYSPRNGVPKGAIFTFTILAGVFLSDVPNRFWGNLVVWPVKLPEPEQILAKAGDVILCHYLLGHTVAINVSPFVRYAVFFRLSHPQHTRHGARVFKDLWLEWPALRKSL